MKNWSIAVAIIILALAIAFSSIMNRYDITPGFTDYVAWKIDKFTGTVWWVHEQAGEKQLTASKKDLGNLTLDEWYYLQDLEYRNRWSIVLGTTKLKQE